MQQRVFLIVALQLLSLSLSIPCWGQQNSGSEVESEGNRADERQREAHECIVLLASDDFNMRESAMDRLRAIGPAARPVLLQGLREGEPEIQWRCALLWQELHTADFQERADRFLNAQTDVNRNEFPAWKTFEKLTGDSQESRRLFLLMQQAEPVVLAQLDDGAQAINTSRVVNLLQRLTFQTQSRMQRQPSSEQPSAGTAATLLFLASLSPGIESTRVGSTINEVLETPLVQDRTLQDAALKKLVSRWIRLGVDDRPAYERMMASLRDERFEDAQIAARELLNQESSAKQKQYAILALARSNNPIDDQVIARYLDDTSPLDTYLTRGVVLKSELRDVALAVSLHRMGKDPEQFGFDYLRRDQRLLFAVTSLGFADSSLRERAFELWKSSVGNDTN